MPKNIIGYALFERGDIGHYYGLHFICLTKKQAEMEKKYYNSKPLNHKFEIKKVNIIICKK